MDPACHDEVKLKQRQDAHGVKPRGGHAAIHGFLAGQTGIRLKNRFAFPVTLHYYAVMQPQKAGSPMRILIVDDEENIRRITVVVLEAMGHESVGVENGAAALQQLENDTFDIAFLDLKLGGESGLDLLPQLLKVNPELEVIVFTAHASIETAAEAMRRGAEDYIPKPFTPEYITRVMKQTATMSEAARILGITRDTLHSKRKEISHAPDVQGG